MYVYITSFVKIYNIFYTIFFFTFYFTNKAGDRENRSHFMYHICPTRAPQVKIRVFFFFFFFFF